MPYNQRKLYIFHWHMIETSLGTVWAVIWSLPEIWFVFCVFLCYLPPELLRSFFQEQFHLKTTQIFLWKKSMELEVLLRFENFYTVAHWFLGCQFQKKIQDFSCNNWIFFSRFISRCNLITSKQSLT